MSDDNSTASETAKLDLHILKAKAVREATFEILGEQRAEIVRRARAKLVAQGVPLAEGEVP